MIVWKAAYHFFAAIGAIVFLGSVYAIAINDGKVDEISTAWIVFPSAIYAWVRCEISQWGGQ